MRQIERHEDVQLVPENAMEEAMLSLIIRREMETCMIFNWNGTEKGNPKVVNYGRALWHLRDEWQKDGTLAGCLEIESNEYMDADPLESTLDSDVIQARFYVTYSPHRPANPLRVIWNVDSSKYTTRYDGGQNPENYAGYPVVLDTPEGIAAGIARSA